MRRLTIGLILLLTACGAIPPQEEYIPTTKEERAKVQATVDAQLARAFPNGMTISGHDQEWYTLVERINKEARQNICRPTQWELQGSLDGAFRTGRWRYFGESQWRNEAIQ